MIDDIPHIGPGTPAGELNDPGLLDVGIRQKWSPKVLN